MIKAVSSQQQQKFKSKRQNRSQFSADTESVEASRSKSRAAYIRELRHDWEDTS